MNARSRQIVYLNIIVLILISIGCSNNHEGNIYIKNANSHDNYFSVHYINQAWKYGSGKGIKIGILDHLFGENILNNYHTVKSFTSNNESQKIIGHGFWMASTLKEIAPDCDVYALSVYDFNEDIMTNAIIEAINWSIENEINILTFSQARLSLKNREKLDPYIDKAYENGIAVIFLHNPNNNNFLPSKIDPVIENIINDPEINIYDQDYSVILRGNVDINGFVDSPKDFKSISSKAVVLAGIISIMQEANPNTTLDQIRNALRKTTYNYETNNEYIKNIVNASEAVKYLIDNR